MNDSILMHVMRTRINYDIIIVINNISSEQCFEVYTKQIKTLYMDIESEFILGIKSYVAAQRIN